MSKTLINFANGVYAKSQRLNSKTGSAIGGFDTVFSYSPKDIDRKFFQQHQQILSQVTGAGYWLWKPYFILKTLQQLSVGDYLFYSDAGAYFVDAIDPVIRFSESIGQDILPFDVGYVEKVHTKRDTFILMGCDSPEFTDSIQRLASFILLKKSPTTMNFVHEYLNFACDERILTDMENQMGYPNYPEFESHRHDQSIYSLLTKKYQLAAFRDPSQWGNGGDADESRQPFGQILEHTREKNISIPFILAKLTDGLKKKSAPEK